MSEQTRKIEFIREAKIGGNDANGVSGCLQADFHRFKEAVPDVLLQGQPHVPAKFALQLVGMTLERIGQLQRGCFCRVHRNDLEDPFVSGLDLKIIIPVNAGRLKEGGCRIQNQRLAAHGIGKGCAFREMGHFKDALPGPWQLKTRSEPREKVFMSGKAYVGMKIKFCQFFRATVTAGQPGWNQIGMMGPQPHMPPAECEHAFTGQHPVKPVEGGNDAVVVPAAVPLKEATLQNMQVQAVE